MASELFKKLLSRVSIETKEDVHLSMQIALRIHELMQKQNMTQSELSRKLGKDPAEINRWLSGMHTFTTKTLSKLHIVLGEPIIKICGEQEELNIKIEFIFKNETTYDNQIKLYKPGFGEQLTHEEWQKASFQLSKTEAYYSDLQTSS